VLTEALAAGGDEAKRALEAMMDMKTIDCRRDQGSVARLTALSTSSNRHGFTD